MQAASIQRPERQAFISFARGLSMFTIVLYHIVEYFPLPSLLEKASHLAGAGIYVFLFASSYGLFFSSVSSWPSFYLKRFKKVLLPYYIGLTLIFITNHFVNVYPDGWPAFLSHIFLYKMFFEPYVQSFGPHFWFISTIVQFYLLWPLLLAMAERLKTRTFLVAAFTISLLYSILTYKLGVQSERIWYSSAIQYFWILALGLAAARNGWFPKLLELGIFKYGLLLAVGVGGGLLINILAGERGNTFNDYFMFLAYFSGSIILFLISRHAPALGRFMLWVESFSYSLYIIHYFVIVLYLKFLAETHLRLFEIPVVLAACFGVGLLFDKAVNRLLAPSAKRVQPALGA